MLLENLVSDIVCFFESKRKYPDVFCNECDLQLQLARYICDKPNRYDKVYLEYFVPGEVLESEIKEKLFVKDNYKSQNLYIDIVVEKDGEFLPIELKYKTVPLNNDISCLGETVKGLNLLKNHGARDLGAYDFWRDVNRIECLVKHFENVKNGIALFLTNDQGYWTLPKDGTNPNYAKFSMLPTEMCGVDKSWQGNTAMSVSRPSFKLEKGYPVKWFPEVDDKAIHSTENFRYCLLKI